MKNFLIKWASSSSRNGRSDSHGNTNLNKAIMLCPNLTINYSLYNIMINAGLKIKIRLRAQITITIDIRPVHRS